jgi:[ribosomal protein S5]-alanine N-acetyltransferase
VIETPRLLLIPLELKHVQALERDPQQLAALLGLTIPDGWPHFPEAYSVKHYSKIKDEPNAGGWGTYLFLSRDRSSLVGSGGYKGRPANGLVEIGYEVAPVFQNQGFATEAAQAMVAHAFSYPEVEFVLAHTLSQSNASTKVLEKAGMAFIGTVADPKEGTVWRWRIARSAVQVSRVLDDAG